MHSLNKRRSLLPNDNYTEGKDTKHFLYVVPSIKFFYFESTDAFLKNAGKTHKSEICSQYGNGITFVERD